MENEKELNIQELQLEELRQIAKILKESADSTNYELRRMATRLEQMNR